MEGKVWRSRGLMRSLDSALCERIDPYFSVLQLNGEVFGFE